MWCQAHEHRRNALAMSAPTSRPPARPASPCVGLCRINPAHGWCEGCFRSLDEIAAWSRLSPADREPIWLSLPLRRQQAAPGSQS